MAKDKPIDRIIEMVVAALEEGVQPWRKPWETPEGAAAVALPLRADHQSFSVGKGLISPNRASHAKELAS